MFSLFHLKLPFWQSLGTKFKHNPPCGASCLTLGGERCWIGVVGGIWGATEGWKGWSGWSICWLGFSPIFLSNNIFSMSLCWCTLSHVWIWRNWHLWWQHRELHNTHRDYHECNSQVYILPSEKDEACKYWFNPIFFGKKTPF